MPETKPANTAKFAHTPGVPGDVQWPAVKEAAGYAFENEVPYEELNGVFERVGRWTSYLNDLLPNLVFTGAADYGRAQIEPTAEVNWATNGTFSRSIDTGAAVLLKLRHSGAGLLTWTADVLNGLTAVQVNDTVEMTRTNHGASGAESHQTLTVGTETTAALGESRLEASAFKPALSTPHVGVGTAYKRDEALYTGNLLKARWSGYLSDTGNALVASALEDAYNMTFDGTAPADRTEFIWSVTDNAQLSASDTVIMTFSDFNNNRLWRAQTTGTANHFDGSQVRCGLAVINVPTPTTGGAAWAGGTSVLLEDLNNITDVNPRLYMTIEIY